MGEVIGPGDNPVDNAVAAVEFAAQIVEALRATGQYQTRYGTEDERAVLQRAGRIARATVKPRRMTVRSRDGVFIALWTDLTPLEDELHRIRMAEAANAIQPERWRNRPSQP